MIIDHRTYELQPGRLRVRDPRITVASFATWFDNQRAMRRRAVD